MIHHQREWTECTLRRLLSRFTVCKLRPFVGFDLRNEEATNIRIKTQLDCKEYIGNYQALQETDVPWRMMCLWRGLVADLLTSLQLKHWWSVGSPFFESPSTRGVARVTRVTTFEHIWTHIRNSSSIYIYISTILNVHLRFTSTPKMARVSSTGVWSIPASRCLRGPALWRWAFTTQSVSEKNVSDLSGFAGRPIAKLVNISPLSTNVTICFFGNYTWNLRWN